jgi:hypothetical protein
MMRHGPAQWAPPPPLTRRRAALLALACALPGAGSGRAGAATLPQPASLAAALAAALRNAQPLVIMASLDGCPFCRIVRDHHLAPLQREVALHVVQLDLPSRQAVRDFDGTATTHEQLLRQWEVRVAPTVLFFGRAGREAAPRLVGASIPDFYGAYLEQRIATARRSVG